MSETAAHSQRVITLRVLDEGGEPIAGIHVARVAANGTFLAASTSREGSWVYEEPFNGTLTFMFAGTARAAMSVVTEAGEIPHPFDVEMSAEPDGGSIIIENGSGHIPGISGRLNPIRDSLGRTYIYGDNLSFNDLPEQPFNFSEGVGFRVVDALGNSAELMILAILGRTSLIQYRTIMKSPTITGV